MDLGVTIRISDFGFLSDDGRPSFGFGLRISDFPPSVHGCPVYPFSLKVSASGANHHKLTQRFFNVFVDFCV